MGRKSRYRLPHGAETSAGRRPDPGEFPELLPGQEKTLFALALRTRDSIMALLGQDLTGE